MPTETVAAGKHPLFRFLMGRVLARAVRRRVITSEQRDEILAESEVRDFQSFLEWLLDNYPAIIEMLMAFMELFLLFA